MNKQELFKLALMLQKLKTAKTIIDECLNTSVDESFESITEEHQNDLFLYLNVADAHIRKAQGKLIDYISPEMR